MLNVENDIVVNKSKGDSQNTKYNIITLIAATDKNGLIGTDNKLPWYCKEESSFFKSLISEDCLLIVTSKTYLSLPESLKNTKKYLIYSRNKNIDFKNDNILFISNDVKELINYGNELNLNIKICGGTQLYREAMLYCDELIISELNLKCNTKNKNQLRYFPGLHMEYILTSSISINKESLMGDFIYYQDLLDKEDNNNINKDNEVVNINELFKIKYYLYKPHLLDGKERKERYNKINNLLWNKFYLNITKMFNKSKDVKDVSIIYNRDYYEESIK